MAKGFVTGKRTTFGNERPKVLNSTRRAWKPSPQKVRILVDGKPKRAWVSTKALKSSRAARV